MQITIFGLAITSSWGNGHATTFRALCKALHARGHRITFFEQDVEWYASNRDMPEPPFCDVLLYKDWSAVLPEVRRSLEECDVAMVGSYFPDGISAVNEMLDSRAPVKTFYDIDTPITIAQLRESGRTDYLLSQQLLGLDVYFSFTGGPLLREIEQNFGARHAVPLYCSFDRDQYRPQPVDEYFRCGLSYMGTYAPDRQPKVEELLCIPARSLNDKKFIVAGPQYPDSIEWPSNVQRLMHLEPRYHPVLYSSSRLVLNVTRRDMVMAGYSPSVRLFEAAACGAAIISDQWPGLDRFLSPGREILLPSGSDDVVRYISDFSDGDLRRIGDSARERMLAEHSNTARAIEFEQAIQGARSARKPYPVGA
jgi:spore maturation protein CgeB